jgi:hypothetical protein
MRKLQRALITTVFDAADGGSGKRLLGVHGPG